MPGENTFYDLHYLTIETKKTTEEIYLRDYDIRSGEVTHTFPLGSFAQKKEDFHITNLGNTLYVLTPRGLFRGECKQFLQGTAFAYSANYNYHRKATF